MEEPRARGERPERPGPSQGQQSPRSGGPSQGRSPSSAQSRAGAARSRSGGRKRRRRGGGRAAAGALLYVVAVLGASLLLAMGAWICAGDVLALNKPEYSATIVLPESAFTAREVTVEDTDEAGNPVKRQETVWEADMGYVADLLKENGLIEYKPLFRLFAWLTKAKTKMTAGTYTLTTEMDYRALISGMSPGSAKRVEIRVTIPEGYNEAQIFHLLEEKGVCTVAELEDMAANHDYKFTFLEGIPLGDPKRLEGYLFPDTYQFYIGEDPLYAINKMLVNFSEMVPPETRTEIEESGRTVHEIVTVASLIEKETDGTDQAVIASVIWNRLNNPDATGGLLQVDATLAYLNGGNVPTEADKAIDSPYNTYLYPGLPKGPIANPGSAALWAAMNPKETKYYYYALGEDGLHHFSKTLQEHERFLKSLKKD